VADACIPAEVTANKARSKEDLFFAIVSVVPTFMFPRQRIEIFPLVDLSLPCVREAWTSAELETMKGKERELG